MNGFTEFLAVHKCTQAEMAKRLGYHKQYISNLVNGRMPITNAFIGRVMSVYGADAAEIFLSAMVSNLTVESAEN